MIVNIGFDNINESNIFLRALWGTFEKRFGKCAWHYAPFKDGSRKVVFLGTMDVGLKECFLVYVHYKRKAVVDKLEFLNENDERVSDLINKQFQEIIKEALMNFKKPDTKYLNTTISSYYSISNYYSEFFNIKPYGNGLSSITISVKSYGDNDTEFVAT